MVWKKLKPLRKGELDEIMLDFELEFGFSFKRKVRYFLDENLGPNGVELFRSWGLNVTDVWETNLVGKPDENIWKFCQKNKRTILTHDDDFMDFRKYPLRKCYGVVILPHKDNHDYGLTEKTSHLCSVLSYGIGMIYEEKIIIRENGHWERFYFSENGKIISNLYDLNDRNHVFKDLG